MKEMIFGERAQAAERNFRSGYNCAQSTVLAFADLVPIDRDVLARLASSFGGGMGRLREVCGAVTGMFMIAGMLCGYETPESGPIKADHYARIQQLAAAFEAQFGTILCRDLLGRGPGKEEPVPEARTEAYYQSRPCGRAIRTAVQILQEYLEENGFAVSPKTADQEEH